jgi:hypothetical protein
MTFSYLDLIKYPAVKITAKTNVTPPTARYAMPSIFFPPNKQVVDNTSFFLA